MIIGLIGYRGSGKTTVGQIVARRRQWAFVDCDQQVIQRAGMSIRQIFERQGEQAFRDLESLCVDDISRLQHTVISFGGGAMDRESNREAVVAARMKIVYLRCEPAELLRRIQSDPQTAANRPNLTTLAGGVDEIQLVLSRREPIWRALGVGEVDVTGISPEDAADRVCDLL